MNFEDKRGDLQNVVLFCMIALVLRGRVGWRASQLVRESHWLLYTRTETNPREAILLPRDSSDDKSRSGLGGGFAEKDYYYYKLASFGSIRDFRTSTQDEAQVTLLCGSNVRGYVGVDRRCRPRNLHMSSAIASFR